jgi:hypothetical protein
MLRVTSRFPKRRAERDLALVVQRLAPKDEDRVLLERRPDLGPRPVVELTRDVDAIDPRGEYRSEPRHDDLAHWFLTPCILAP